MDVTSLPVLPHLPSAESWRESTQLLALWRSPELQILDEALELYENSFRRYSSLCQSYYLQLGARQSEPDLYREQGVRSIREQAQAAWSRAVCDFEVVESAFSTWIHSGHLPVAVPEVYQLRSMIDAGHCQLSRKLLTSRDRRRFSERRHANFDPHENIAGAEESAPLFNNKKMT